MDHIAMRAVLALFAAAVVNAENRNRLNEEDRCWREKTDKKNAKKSGNKSKNSLAEPTLTTERVKSKRNNDKWVILHFFLFKITIFRIFKI